MHVVTHTYLYDIGGFLSTPASEYEYEFIHCPWLQHAGEPGPLHRLLASTHPPVHRALLHTRVHATLATLILVTILNTILKKKENTRN